MAELLTKRQRLAIVQRNARKVVAEIYQPGFEAGDRFSLMHAIDQCFRAGVVAPPWVVEAFGKGYRAVAKKQAKSWDDDAAFGRPWPKGTHLATERRNDRLRAQVYQAIRAAQRPKDEHLFAEVGKKFGIKGSVCRDLYYEEERRVRELFDPLDKPTG